MKCFIIMPYHSRFDDVHHWIRQGVSTAVPGMSIEAFRLDEDQRAGRIVGRLEKELAGADFCVADVTGRNANVMWEIGYAMALGKPPILIADAADTEEQLPFDLRDMHRIVYNRLALRQTLAVKLATSVRHTIDALASESSRRPPGSEDSESAAVRHGEAMHHLERVIVEMREMVQVLVQRVGPNPIGLREPVRDGAGGVASRILESLEGAWVNVETGSHAYVRGIRGSPVAPYCFGGNDTLSGAYYGWRDDGGWIFGRYAWRHQPISGFTYLRRRSDDELEGQWWFDPESAGAVVEPPDPASGFDSRWVRRRDLVTPAWAEQFFAEVERFGLERALGREATR